MRRRIFIAGVAGAVAWPLVAPGQTPDRIYRRGLLANSSPLKTLPARQRCRSLRLGFVEGPNLVFDARTGEPDLLPSLMRELLTGQPDAIVAVGPFALRHAGAVTRTVPKSISAPTRLNLVSRRVTPGREAMLLASCSPPTSLGASSSPCC